MLTKYLSKNLDKFVSGLMLVIFGVSLFSLHTMPALAKETLQKSVLENGVKNKTSESIALAPNATDYGFAVVVPNGRKMGESWTLGDSLDQYNSTGGEVVATRDSAIVGRIVVSFRGLGRPGRPGGHVQVKAWNSHFTCQINNWLSGGENFDVTVDCYGLDHNPFSTAFVIFVTWPPPSAQRLAYFWADQPDAEDEYLVPQQYSMNTAAGAPASPMEKVQNTGIWVRRVSEGRYLVRIAGLGDRIGGNVQISTYGRESAVCHVVYWLPLAGSSRELWISVFCERDGQPQDTQFTGLVAWPNSHPAFIAYLSNDNVAEEIPHYVPSEDYSFNSTKGNISMHTRDIGQYFIDFNGFENLGYFRGNLLVTEYGEDRLLCFSGPSSGFPVGINPIGLTARIDCLSPTILSGVKFPEPGTYIKLGGYQPSRFGALLLGAFERPSLPPMDVTVTVSQLNARSSDSCNERMDFYGAISVIGTTRSDGHFGVWEGNEIRPNWRVTAPVAADTRTVDAIVSIRDEDDFFCGGGDDWIDINPDPDQIDLRIRIDMMTYKIFRLNRDGTVGPQIGSVFSDFRTEGTHGVENAEAVLWVNAVEK